VKEGMKDVKEGREGRKKGMKEGKGTYASNMRTKPNWFGSGLETGRKEGRRYGRR
jgi:hypothetical protein